MSKSFTIPEAGQIARVCQRLYVVEQTIRRAARMIALWSNSRVSGLRVDLERFEYDTVTALVESLKRHGVSEDIINTALTEVVQQ